jgi:hypothetical protein
MHHRLNQSDNAFMHIEYILLPETPSVRLYTVDDNDDEVMLNTYSADQVDNAMWLKGTAGNTKGDCPEST